MPITIEEVHALVVALTAQLATLTVFVREKLCTDIDAIEARLDILESENVSLRHRITDLEAE